MRFVKAHPQWAIFLLALAVRLAWVLLLSDSVSFPDEEEFVAVAQHIAAGDGYVSSSYRANPTFPAYLGLMFSVFGSSFLPARIGQAAIGALTCVILYRTSLLLSGTTVALLSGVLLALYPPHIALSGVFYGECLLIFLASLCLMLAVRTTIEPGGLAWGILCGAIAGITVLTRPTFAAFLPFLCAAWLYATRPRWREQLGTCAAVLLASFVVVAPWTIRNYRVFGRLVPVSSGFYTLLWQGNNALSDGGSDDRFLFWGTPDWAERLSRIDESERRAIMAKYADADQRARALAKSLRDRYLATDSVLAPIVRDEMLSHPGRTLMLFGRKLVTLYSAFTNTYVSNDLTASPKRLLAAVTFYPLLALAAAGVWFGRRESPSFVIIYAYIGSMSCVYALIAACTRFRLPLDPYFIILASVTLVRTAEAWSVIRGRRPLRVLADRGTAREPR